MHVYIRKTVSETKGDETLDLVVALIPLTANNYL